MASYPPPNFNENLTIFNTSNWEEAGSTTTSSGNYLEFPVAQGTETLQEIIVNGISTFNQDITVNAPSTFKDDINITDNADLYAQHNLSVDNELTINNYIMFSNDNTKITTGFKTDETEENCMLGANTPQDSVGREHLTAFGANALKNIESVGANYHNDCAFGANTLQNETTGIDNTAIGYNSLQNLTTAIRTTAIGSETGQTITNQSNNICLGFGADTFDNTISNSVAIGNEVKTTADNQILLGSSTQFVKIPNYIEFSDGTQQSTASGGGGGPNLELTGYLIVDGTSDFNGGVDVNNNTSINVYNDDTAPTINKSVISPSSIQITGAVATTTNTINSTSSTITDGTDSNIQSKNLITLKGASNTTNYNSMGKQAINIIGDTINDKIELGTTTGVDFVLNVNSPSYNSSLNAEQLLFNTIATPTITKSVINKSGFTITGGETTTITEIADGIINTRTAGFINNQTPSLITLRTPSSSTTDLSTLSRTALQITGATASIYNGMTALYNTLVDTTNTTVLYPNDLNMYLTGSSPSSTSSSKLTNLGLNFYDATSTSVASGMNATEVRITGSGAVKNVMTNANTIISGSSSTLNKTTLQQTGLEIITSPATTKNTITGTSIVIATGSAKNTMSPAGITQVLVADETINKSVLNNTGLTLTGSTTSSTNTITALTNTITDGTRSISNIVNSTTATLKLLSAQSFGQSTTITPNLIVNSGSDGSSTNNTRITGTSFLVNGAAGVSNTAVALSNTITDGVRTIFTGMSSSIATIKLNAASSGGNSLSITPSSINITGVDGTTSTTNTSISSTQLSIIGSSAARKTDIKNPPNSGTGTEGFCIDITSDQNNYSTSNFNTGYIMLNNTNAGAGTTGCVNTIFKRGKTVAPDDCIGLTSYVAVGAGAPIGNREFARIASFCKTNIDATNCDGSLMLSARVNTAIADMIELNGALDKVVAYKPIIVDTTGGSATTNITNITNTTTTLTGGTTSSTNTITAVSNTITDAVRTIFTGISSSIATIKLNAAASLGNVVSITPSSIGIFTDDGVSSYGGATITSTSIQILGTSTSSQDYAKIIPNPPNTSGVVSAGGALLDIKTATYDFNNTLTSGMMVIQTSSTAGTGGINYAPSMLFRRFNNAPVGSALGTMRFVGYSNGSTGATEYGRITTFVKNQGVSADDGRMLFQTSVNNVLTNFLELDGGEEQINAFKPLDLNNNSIVSSTGGITLDTSSSASGNPYITLTPNSTGGYIILNNIPTGAGGPTGSLYKTGGGALHIN
jgi:hypothetical protein